MISDDASKKELYFSIEQKYHNINIDETKSSLDGSDEGISG